VSPEAGGGSDPPPEATRRAMLRLMKLQREVERRIVLLYRQGKIVGGVYTGLGQEAIGAGSAVLTRAGDSIFPSHRDLSAFLARGMTPETILAQYLGRVDGPTRGRDGNLHMGDWSLGIGAFVSHMADTVPVAAGVALSHRLRGEPGVVLCYNGDGATSRGDWHEGLNLAAVQSLPVVYICVNNRYAYSTPLEGQMAVDRVAERAPAYGMPGVTVDGNDPEAVWRAVKPAVERARTGEGPSLVECMTWRMTGHSAHDDAAYVPEAFFEEGRRNDPIRRHQERLVAEGVLDDDELDALDREIRREVDEAAERALESPAPPAEEALTGVFAEEGWPSGRPPGAPGAGDDGAGERDEAADRDGTLRW